MKGFVVRATASSCVTPRANDATSGTSSPDPGSNSAGSESLHKLLDRRFYAMSLVLKITIVKRRGLDCLLGKDVFASIQGIYLRSANFLHAFREQFE